MHIFNRKQTENKTIKENVTIEEANLICEEEIIKDKERFGRTRSSLMSYLRVTYGRDIADRALWRVNRRISEGYLS